MTFRLERVLVLLAIVGSVAVPRCGVLLRHQRLERALSGRAEGGSCVIRYPVDRLRDSQLRRLVDDCDWAWRRVQAVLGELPRGSNGSVLLWVYPDEQQMRSLTNRPWGAYAESGEVHVVSDRSRAATTLKHELTHVYGYRLHATRRTIKTPRALREGLAVAVASGYYKGQRMQEEFAAALDKGCTISLIELLGDRSFGEELQRKECEFAGSFVGFLIDRWGAGQFTDLYQDGDYERVYARNLNELEREWHEYLLTIDNEEGAHPEAVATLCKTVDERPTDDLKQTRAVRESVLEDVQQLKTLGLWEEVLRLGISGLDNVDRLDTRRRLVATVRRAYVELGRDQEALRWLEGVEQRIPELASFIQFLELHQCLRIGYEEKANSILALLVTRGELNREHERFYRTILESPARDLATKIIDETSFERRMELTRQATRRDASLFVLYSYVSQASGLSTVQKQRALEEFVGAGARAGFSIDPEELGDSYAKALEWLADRAEEAEALETALDFVDSALMHCTNPMTVLALEEERDRLRFRLQRRGSRPPSASDTREERRKVDRNRRS